MHDFLQIDARIVSHWILLIREEAESSGREQLLKVLVVGGAGYIGSHAVRECRRCGIQPVIFDNLSTGNALSVEGDDLIQGNLHSARDLRSTFESQAFDAVFHFAASCSVPESMENPALYYHNNVAGTLNLVDAMLAAGVHKLIFSSTAAVYGDPEETPIPEDHLKRPVNPYGESKLLVEKLLSAIAEKHPLRYIALRYFNAAGADPEGGIGEDHEQESHLIPLIFQTALGLRGTFKIFGTDYETPDGTCIRDFVHVTDIARAHLLALEKMDHLPRCAYNLGSSDGYSVQEVINEAQILSGVTIPVVEEARRDGDPPVLVASNELAGSELGWKPEHSELTEILQTAWKWHSSHPHGFGSPPESHSLGKAGSTELFGDVAVRLGLVSKSDVERALEDQRKEAATGADHKMIGMHMLEMGILSTSQLIEILKHYEQR